LHPRASGDLRHGARIDELRQKSVFNGVTDVSGEGTISAFLRLATAGPSGRGGGVEFSGASSALIR
jgi:hypothetical protein